jgi:hypothetical protein
MASSDGKREVSFASGAVAAIGAMQAHVSD